jgi:hypothetical protein
MNVVTRKSITAIALVGVSIASGLVLVGAGARLASANPNSTDKEIKCDNVKMTCEECDPSGACTACDQWGCGTNTAEVQGKPIGALHLAGEENPAGFRIDPVLHKNGEKYQLLVQNGEIIGKKISTNVGLVGKALEGSSFMLHSAAPIHGQTEWKVQIDAVAVVPLFAVRSPSRRAQDDAATYEYAFAYKLGLPNGGGESPYVCPEVSAWGWETHKAPEAIKGYQVLSWQNPDQYAVLVKGETYDPNEATVALKGKAGQPWFNIACAGTAIAKMKLMGYDPEETKYPTRSGQRQATLKMITARYCGSMSFTENGQPLIWQNALTWFRPETRHIPTRVPGDIEAVWNKDGAICLNRPRRTQSWPRRKVIDTCQVQNPIPIPTCDDYFQRPTRFMSDIDILKAAHGEWVTRHSALP